MTKEWIAVIGSPRRGENTEKLIDVIISALENKRINVRKFYLDRKQMSPCTNCEYCITRGKCYIDDEISEIICEMKMADGIILATPSYNYNVNSQMKVLLDRMFSLNDFTGPEWKSRLIPGKKAIVAGVCKGSTKESMGYTTEAMRKAIDELGIEVIDVIEYYDTKNNPVGSNIDKIEQVKERIKSIEII